MFWKKKKKQEEVEVTTREIPRVDISDFDPPSLIKQMNINADDTVLIENLTNEFKKNGIVDSNNMNDNIYQTLDELNNILDDANALAKNEKDFHKQFYDEKLDDSLTDYEDGYDFENPVLDGIDDYGNQVYNDMRKKPLDESLPSISTPSDVVLVDDSSDLIDDDIVRVILPDGRIILGKVL